MGKTIKLRIIVLGGCLLAVTGVRAERQHVDAAACLSLMRAFDVFNERHGDGSATAEPSDGASVVKPGSYLPELNRIRRAAGQGNIQAEAAMGGMYLQGRCGLPKDPDKALELGARAGGYFDIAMMYMHRRKPVEAYKWFRIGLLKDPWYSEHDVRLTLEQAGIKHPSAARVRQYLDRVTMSKEVMRGRLELLKTIAHMSHEQIANAERQAREWLKTHHWTASAAGAPRRLP